MQPTLEDISRLLNSDEVGQRQLGAKKLEEYATAQGRQIVVEFLQKEEHAEVLEHLCAAARNCGAVEAEPLLVELLDSPVGDVVVYACGALEKLGSEASVEPLRLALVRSSDEQAKKAALKALECMKRKQPLKTQVIEQLQKGAAELKSSPDSSDKQMAREAERIAYEAPPKTEAADMSLPLEGVPFQARSKPEVLAELDKIYAGFNIEHEAAKQSIKVGLRYERDEKLVRKAKQENRSNCVLCQSPFFRTRSGTFYCEVAHIQPLAHKGADSIENILVVCANCHKELDLGGETRIEVESRHLTVHFMGGRQWKFLLQSGKQPQLICAPKEPVSSVEKKQGEAINASTESILPVDELSLFGDDLT